MLNDLNDVYAVIVLYKKKLSDSITYQTLIQAVGHSRGKLRLLVYNNSPSYFDDELVIPPYILLDFQNDECNSGVSNAYNIAAEKAQNLGKKWLLLLDQDTEISSDYFDDFLVAKKMYNKIKVFVPIIMSKGRIVSPATYVPYRGVVKSKISEGLCSLRSLALINSCTIVCLELFQSVNGFNKDINLDFSDIYFFKKLRSEVKDVCVIKTVCLHGFSGFDYESKDQAISRYLVFLRNARAFKEQDGVNALFLYLTVLSRTFKLTIQFRTTLFFSILIKQHEKRFD